MTTPYQDSVLLSSSAGVLQLPTDGNYGSSPAQPLLYPQGNAPIQVVPGITEGMRIEDAMDEIISYLQSSSSLNLSRPVESLTMMVPTYPGQLAGTGTPVQLVTNAGTGNNSAPMSTIVGPINISTTGGDTIKFLFNNGVSASITVPAPSATSTTGLFDSYYVLSAVPDTGFTPSWGTSGPLRITTIVDPYRASSAGTKNVIIVAYVQITPTAGFPSVTATGTQYSYQIQVTPAANMGTSVRAGNTVSFYLDNDHVVVPVPVPGVNANVPGIITSPVGFPTSFYVSGVESVASGSSITVEYELVNVVNGYYNDTPSLVGPVTGTNIGTNTNSWSDPVSANPAISPAISTFTPATPNPPNPPVNNTSVTFRNQLLVSRANDSATAPAIFWAATASTNNNGIVVTDTNAVPIMYDTASIDLGNGGLITELTNPDLDAFARIHASNFTPASLTPPYTGLVGAPADISVVSYPRVTGTAYNSTTSLATAGNFELQLINGSYRYPLEILSTPYSSMFPSSAGDYSALPADTTGYRWVAFVLSAQNPAHPLLSSVRRFRMTFTNPNGFAGVATANAGLPLVSGIQVLMKVINVPYLNTTNASCGYVENGGAFVLTSNGSAWFDCNTESNMGTPAIDLDGVVVNDDGTNTLQSKWISFGSRAYTGRLLFRIGLPPGSPISFSGVAISAMS